MIVTGDIAEVRAARWGGGNLSWGFVPTMGYLHAGHLALVERAIAENERTAVSIYVNPTQFGPREDFSSYPRALTQDMALLENAGVDLVFTPSDSVMYPVGFQTAVAVPELSMLLEGASRPGHFAGVATVVAKLFNIVQPTRAYFGQKDAQQSVVLGRMVTDLNFPVDLIVCPTVREHDGLAMSSRNAYLFLAERTAAVVLYQALTAAKEALLAGQRDGPALRQLIEKRVAAEPLARLDYAAVVHPHTLTELTVVEESALLLLAVFMGRTRLIDNMLVELAG